VVSDQLRARVLAVAAEIGYKPNVAARALASGRTHCVAWWAADCFTPFYSQVGRYVAQRGVRHHYHVMVNSLHHHVSDPLQSAQFLPWHVDGVLVCDIHPTESLIPSLYDAATPIVAMGTFHDSENDFVGIDLYEGTVLAIRHLLRPGCRRVAYLCNREATRVRDPRSRAYFDVLQEAGLPPECIPLPDQQRPAARQTIVEYVRAHGLPEAIFCTNDDIALGCYRGLQDLGVRLPEDVALVGCDGLPELEYLETPISTIAPPVETMCELAWDFLERRIENPSLPMQTTTLPTQLVARASSLR
jgi:LacI family transcriptional regulator